MRVTPPHAPETSLAKRLLFKSLRADIGVTLELLCAQSLLWSHQKCTGTLRVHARRPHEARPGVKASRRSAPEMHAPAKLTVRAKRKKVRSDAVNQNHLTKE